MHQDPGWLKWGFVGPTLLFLIVLNVFPLIYNVMLSFTDAQLGRERREFVGVANYSRVFEDPRFAGAMRTKGLFVVAAVSAELLLGFILALALQKGFRGKSAVLTILLIPMMLSPAVMGLYWHQILNGTYGVLNQVLRAVIVDVLFWMSSTFLKVLSFILL